MAHSRRLVWASGAIALLLVSVLTGLVTAGRWDDPTMPGQHPYLEGFLTVNGDNYGISWDPAAPSEDNRPADPTPGGDQAEDLKFQLDGGLNDPYSMQYPYTSGFKTSGARPSETFVSLALPQRMIMNVTRGFQVTLFLSTQEFSDPCEWQWEYQAALGYNQWYEPQFDLEVYAGDRLIAGGYGNDYIHWPFVYPNKAEPSSPDGYKACYYQLHSEVRVLEEGTILKLKINHPKQRHDYPLGLTGDHRSSIRIWAYPPEEIVFRHPELAEQLDASMDGEAGSSDGEGAYARDGAAPDVPALPVLGGLALVSGLALPSMRRTRPWILALALGAAAVLSGCLSGGPKDQPAAGETLGGRLTNTLVKGAGDFGTIAGQVHDDIHIPLSGVHVSILGLTNFTQTDGKGRFTFTNLLPGTYKLRFDKNEYKSFEADVEVKAGYISNPSIMLFLKNQKDADYRPHNHDYWDGVTKKVRPPQVLKAGCLNEPMNCQWQNGFQIYPGEDDPRLILPGTTELELTFEWNEAELGVDKLGLILYSRQGNVSMFAPRGSGEPYHIQTTWEMTDVGHSRTSSWFYYWFVPLGEQPTWEEQRMAPEVTPTITVKTTVHRGGKLPLEPPHPDNWKGRDVIDVFKGVQGYAYSYGLLPPSAEGQCLAYFDCSGIQYYGMYPPHTAPPISYGTQWIEVTGRITPEPSTSYLIDLYYKPANVPYSMTNEETLEGYKKASPLPGSTPGKMTYRFKISEDEADSEYSTWTNWRYTFRFTDEDAWWQDNLVNNPGYAFDLKIHRDPFPG